MRQEAYTTGMLNTFLTHAWHKLFALTNQMSARIGQHYKIDTTQVPIELHSHMYRCTATYITTEGWKRLRLRFLAESDIADDEKF